MNPNANHVVPPIAKLLGREVLSRDNESGEVRVRFLARDDFANRHGTVQGGVLTAMLDSACGNALNTGLAPELKAVTTRLDTVFLRPAPIGPLVASARITRRDPRSADIEAEIGTEDGQICAKAVATMRLLDRETS
ncbi:MAG: hypothetical protein A4S14_19750 [Proteobacteria bacterium SG_bin9]|nr:MAG: hypothetical protein A4S14_19750 [Proteobacteria bacterium SG_bin9]